ncbi:MAG: KEOPS complex kinase/ATPase Bud32 [Candidatus Woesearchaeota archaeon]
MQGAEAIITIENGIVTKYRPSKHYRIAELDRQFTVLRTRKEAKILQKAYDLGIAVPKILSVNESTHTITMEHIPGEKVRDCLTAKNQKEIAHQIGQTLKQLHDANIIHGDLTTSNMILKDKAVYFIDFGLSYISKKIEDKAVDLHLLKSALDSYHVNTTIFSLILESYNDASVVKRFEIVQKRGKNKH